MPLRRGMRAPVVYPYDTPPRKGDFGLTKGGGLPMLVTRLGTFSRYGHACVALDDPYIALDGTERIQIIEAAPRSRKYGTNGARIRNARVTEFRWSNLKLTDEGRDRIAARAASCEGIPYDWPAILGFIVRVWGYKLRLIGTKDRPDEKMICSELCVWSYYADKIDLAQGKAPGDTSPGDLMDYLVSH